MSNKTEELCLNIVRAVVGVANGRTDKQIRSHKYVQDAFAALLDAKNAEIARLQEDIAELPTIAWLDGAHRAGKERDEALAALAEAGRKNEVLLAEWNEALARAEWAEAERLSAAQSAQAQRFRAERAEQALADRDAAIVEAVRRALHVGDEPPSVGVRADWITAPLKPFPPAPEPVDPLVKVLKEIADRGVPVHESGWKADAALIRETLAAARGGKIVFEGEGK